jgi:hypothetical protein
LNFFALDIYLFSKVYLFRIFGLNMFEERRRRKKRNKKKSLEKKKGKKKKENHSLVKIG